MRRSYISAARLLSASYRNITRLGIGETAGEGRQKQEIRTVPFICISATIASGRFTANNIPLNPGSNTIKAEAIDAVGNVNSHQISVTYNSPNAAATTYTYNKNGNLTQRKVGTTTENFSYDYDNRLKSYTSPTQAASYTYDGQGRRISKAVNNITTKYYYDGNEIILEKAGSNSIYYIHGPRVDEIIWDSRGYCYQSDGLGSVTNLTDANGAKVTSYDYKAFGQIRNQSGTASNQWLYTGRQLDPESGLYFYRNRYYDARVGRFTTRDPLGIKGGINLYAYCSNNPINFVDPWGLDVYIGGRSILGSGGHTAIILVPDDESVFINDSRFTRNPETGKLEADISAGPNGDKLAPYSYSTDRMTNSGMKVTPLADPKGRSDTHLINDILSSTGRYDSSLYYDPFALGGCYNSNSYVRGILKAVGIENTPLPDNRWYPGWTKPISLEK